MASAADQTTQASEHIDASRRLVVIQRNPTSGSGKGRQELHTLITELRGANFKVRLFASRERLDAYVAMPGVAEQIRCLVAAGGDGTIGSLVNRHAGFPIATLPMGTENLVSRHLGINRDGHAVAGVIKAGRIRRFDVGEANGVTFLLMASVGIDADVVRRLHHDRSGNIHHLSYLKPIVKSFFNYSYPKLTVLDSDGEVVATGSHVIATNVPEYGFRMKFSPDSDPHDGRVDVRVFQRFGLIATVLHVIRTRLGMKDRSGHVFRLVLQDIEIQSSSPSTPCQCDGDPVPDCPLKIRMNAAAMTLVVAE